VKGKMEPAEGKVKVKVKVREAGEVRTRLG